MLLGNPNTVAHPVQDNMYRMFFSGQFVLSTVAEDNEPYVFLQFQGTRCALVQDSRDR